MSRLVRKTKETEVEVEVARGLGEAKVDLADPFVKHMLETFAKYAGLDLRVKASGDLPHHIHEDVAITLGRALREEIDLAKVARIGHAFVPMDDALVLVAIDLVDRPNYHGNLADEDWAHFHRSLAFEARFTHHVDVMRGTDSHHVVEASIKALGLALRIAMAPRGDLLSTKGIPKIKKKR
ncbi:MAG: imidazoleglycerol-phosphate dehydratase [Methanobacteriota archaeon]